MIRILSSFYHAVWSTFSNNSIDLIIQSKFPLYAVEISNLYFLCCIVSVFRWDPAKRITASEALKHNWIMEVRFCRRIWTRRNTRFSFSELHSLKTINKNHQLYKKHARG